MVFKDKARTWVFVIVGVTGETKHSVHSFVFDAPFGIGGDSPNDYQ